MFVIQRIHEMATNGRPVQNSFIPTSTATESRVNSCDLCIVTAHILALMVTVVRNMSYQTMTKTYAMV